MHLEVPVLYLAGIIFNTIFYMLAVLRHPWVSKEIYVQILLSCVELIDPLSRDDCYKLFSGS